MTQTIDSRRYDIDWLRTLAFGLLILYHIGMYYVAEWGWHIKSPQQFAWLQDLMLLTNPWRMSLLFFISGIALALVADRYGAGRLVALRSSRLLIPLLFGMFVIVSPQPYFEALDQDLIQPGFLAFWLDYINPFTSLLRDHHSPIGLLTWNHLWFLPYLWIYSLLLIALLPLLNRLAANRQLAQLRGRWALLMVMGLLLAAWLTLRYVFPSTHALLDDWYNHAKYLPVFMAGYLFARQGSWWQQVIRYRMGFLAAAVTAYLLIIIEHHGLVPGLDALYARSFSARAAYGALYSINHWAWILALVGLAGHWLNRPSGVLRYTDKAILPWYMLHQTLIIVFAANLSTWQLPTALEAALILLLTCAGCYLGYELVRRIAWLRWLFGLKADARRVTPARLATPPAVAIQK
ncbi:acyltransferase family protein [Bowmanella dokdonensis]|uniref:Acyltransferase family protein n=1 Tax=Bowmanella dokdonensis TaxID=751969 RepID=A0A939INL4_9ALTE|nr:acyltransferase family protein [Bowmanella dokdonensis]MBN7826483.1 acyltransferase family protein [Bowmanella dokdonensis]